MTWPTIKGTTVDELLAPFRDAKDKARAVYDPDGSGSVPEVGRRVAADRTEIEPARFEARGLAMQGQKVYLYRFAYVAENMRTTWPGATHVSEVPYAFSTLRARYGRNVTAADQAMTRAMHQYWVDFATTGDPNGAGLIEWPALQAVRSSDNELLLQFTNEGLKLQSDPLQQRLDLTDPDVRAAPAESFASQAATLLAQRSRVVCSAMIQSPGKALLRRGRR